VVSLANEYGGVAFPAHIDRPSHGAIQMLGDVHEDMGFTAVEISPQASDEFVESYRKRGYVILRNSDAHCLENLNEQTSNFFELEKVTASAVLDKLAKR
jgi:PHP family Zn ribbon phosphoesterase